VGENRHGQIIPTFSLVVAMGREDRRGSGSWNVGHTFAWATPGFWMRVYAEYWILDIERQLLFFSLAKGTINLTSHPELKDPSYQILVTDVKVIIGLHFSAPLSSDRRTSFDHRPPLSAMRRRELSKNDD
jgi:hypothetical protein